MMTEIKLEDVPLFLAPMSGVSDLPFRLLARECGADFTITEFTSSAALSRDIARSWIRLESDPRERPFIPQIFGGDLDEMVHTVELLQEKSDIIDLNFGCPAPKVTNICAGAALMGKPEKLYEIVKNCIDVSNVPLTAKLRLGTGTGANTVLEICEELENIGVMRLCVHGRTLRQGYSGTADWDLIRQVVESVNIPVIANGDIVDSHSAKLCLEKTDAAGLMIGRGAIGRPMLFTTIKQELGWDSKSPPWNQLTKMKYNDSDKQDEFVSRLWCWNRYVELCKETTGLQPKWLMRHAISFTKQLPGSKFVRKMMQDNRTPELFIEIVEKFLEAGSRNELNQYLKVMQK